MSTNQAQDLEREVNTNAEGGLNMAIGVEHKQMFSDLALDFKRLFKPHFVPRILDVSDRLMAGQVIQTKDIFGAFRAGLVELARFVRMTHGKYEKSCTRIKALCAIQDHLQASREREISSRGTSSSDKFASGRVKL